MWEEASRPQRAKGESLCSTSGEQLSAASLQTKDLVKPSVYSTDRII